MDTSQNVLHEIAYFSECDPIISGQSGRKSGIKLKDYIKFIQLNILGLQGQDNYLKAKTYAFIHKGVENYSLGWYNIYENGNELSTHSGTVGTYYTLVHIDRIKNIAYIIFTNSFNQQTQQGIRLLMRRLKENYGS